MPELFTTSQRSRIMASVKSRDTTPEILVRRIVHRLGFRYRLHRRDLPGTPDIVLTGRGKIINVHGCFWHMHSCQRRRTPPVQNAEYWSRKRDRNSARDKKVLQSLRRLGWKVLVVWECQTSTKKIQKLERCLVRFLGDQ